MRLPVSLSLRKNKKNYNNIIIINLLILIGIENNYLKNGNNK
jgi:hypothetical protein